MVSGRSTQHVYVDASHQRAVQELFPSTNPKHILACPPFEQALQESTGYRVGFGNWVLFVGRDARGKDYLALGLCYKLDATAGYTTVFTIPNSGSELFLARGRHIQLYLNNRHRGYREVADGYFIVFDVQTDECLHFENGVQLVEVPINATAIPTLEPPAALVKLFASGLAECKPALLDAALQDLSRFRQATFPKNMRCKLTRGFFVGVVGTVYQQDATHPRGHVHVKLWWNNQYSIVTTAPSSLTTQFEIGDLVTASNAVEGWIVGQPSLSTYTVQPFDLVRRQRTTERNYL